MAIVIVCNEKHGMYASAILTGFGMGAIIDMFGYVRPEYFVCPLHLTAISRLYLAASDFGDEGKSYAIG